MDLEDGGGLVLGHPPGQSFEIMNVPPPFLYHLNLINSQVTEASAKMDTVTKMGKWLSAHATRELNNREKLIVDHSSLF